MRTLATWVVINVIVVATWTVAGAQAPTKIARIGTLSGGVSSNDVCRERFRRGMRELGWVEGKTYTLESRWAEGKSETLAQRAAELAALKVDLILTYGAADVGVAAARQASPTTPVVVATGIYLAETGLIASLGRPGGNITGVSLFSPELMAKRVQVLKETVPAATRVAIITLEGRTHDLIVKDFETAARGFGIQTQVILVRRPEDLPGAFETAVRGGARAVMTTQGPFFRIHREQIAALALKHKLPSLSGEQGAPDAGTLLFYGPYVFDGCQRAATYVDRILKGAKAGDLPVEQPARIELVVNLKTAKALGLTIPPAVLGRADRVIE
ncbi:MAG: ABC transporter substrate-binding protein [Candidatus Rokubacteria bacterium]|nr:ABC transporter substrate-binding protein [Candidatus Rokubacteria bacterium]